jgi:tyrosyl-tRNA synthetase
MSKSLGNYIGITESAESMYGKVMSIPDALIMSYFELATEMPLEEIKIVKKKMDEGENPRNIKMWLAREIIKLYHSEKDAQKAEEAFVKTFQKKEVPDDVEILKYSKPLELLHTLVKISFSVSATEAKRLIEEGGIKVNGKVITDPYYLVTINIEKSATGGVTIQKGKRFFVRIV